MHIIDYWTGFYSSRVAHKQLIFQSFREFKAADYFIKLVMSAGCREPQPTAVLLCNASDHDVADKVMKSFSEKIAFGAHHDTITGTSTSVVHEQERTLFQTREHMELLTFIVHSFYNSGSASSEKQLANFFVLNNNLQSRTQVVSLMLEEDQDKDGIQVKVNGQNVSFAIYPNLALREAEMHMMNQKMVDVQMPEVAPMSVNHIEILSSPTGTDPNSASRLIRNEHRPDFIENDELRVHFDRRTWMPSSIEFKNLK